VQLERDTWELLQQGSTYNTIIAETEKLQLIYHFEKGFLADKVNQLGYALGWFYGDPTCGIIDRDNRWAILSGVHLTMLWQNNQQQPLEIELPNIFDMRQVNTSTLQALTDPWSEKSAIYTININTRIPHKVVDFPTYRDKPYTEDVIW